MDNTKQEFAELVSDIKNLEKKYSLSYKQILEILENKKSTSIPVSIFNEKLGSLESTVKYLKENIGLSIKEISFLTKRMPQPILTTYLRAKKKYPQKLAFNNYNQNHKKELSNVSNISIPIEIMHDKKHSVLENIVLYLEKNNFTIQQIADITKRDYKTIWTIRQRITEKKKESRIEK